MKIMNYPFIIEVIRLDQFRKIAMLLLCMTSFVIHAQVVHTDSIAVHKTWYDKNGKNTLSIKVNALCNANKPPFDGHVSIINASLTNKNYAVTNEYNDENYQMEMLLFYEKDIWFHVINKVKAVFIPFFYCGNMDTNNKVSYLIFYNNTKYLYHINYRCNEDNACTLNENLQLKLKDLPTGLKKVFMKVLQSKYKKATDLYRG